MAVERKAPPVRGITDGAGCSHGIAEQEEA
jgi:hypothetical protein